MVLKLDINKTHKAATDYSTLNMDVPANCEAWMPHTRIQPDSTDDITAQFQGGHPLLVLPDQYLPKYVLIAPSVPELQG